MVHVSLLKAKFLHLRLADPIFAVSIGVTAALVRINREEKEKGRTTEQSIEALKRRTRAVFGGGEREREMVVEGKGKVV